MLIIFELVLLFSEIAHPETTSKVLLVSADTGVMAVDQRNFSTVVNPLLSVSDLADVTLELCVEFGRAELSVKRLLSLRPGSVIELGGDTDQGFNLYANGGFVARGEIVTVNDHYGLRVTSIESPEK
ncbi:MAG: FliM/FliN family flagellar motor switch protein [Bdellovibrionales bacterium]|nr:FliM/FliN family flagellar motor switch protein [Bdellovibrionales bacterium]